MAAKSRKMKVSKVKHSNQVITKLKKQGKIKSQRHRKKKVVNKPQQKGPKAPVKQSDNHKNHSDNESLQGSDIIDMFEQDDLDYLLETAASKSKSAKQDKQKNNVDQQSDEENLEMDYENTIETKPVQKKKKYLLPIKTKDGFKSRELEVDSSKKTEDDAEGASSDKKEDAMSDDEKEDSTAEDENMEDAEKPEPVTATALMVARHEDLQNKKVLIGSLCSGLLESPEMKMGNFFTLFYLMDEKSKSGEENLLTVRKLAMISVLEVFKDILPDYQITQQDFGEVKLKKDTLVLNKYETSLLEQYKRYLQRLEKTTAILIKKKGDTRKHDDAKMKLGCIAITCLCDLLVAHPYFNYSSNLAQMLTPFLNSRIPSVRQTVHDCFRTVFKDDKKGLVSLMMVRKINNLVKTRQNDVNCEVLSCLMALRIKDVNLDNEKKLELKQKKQMSHKQRLISMSKKERKRNKKLQELEKEMLETKAEENKQTKQQNLTEITKVVFTIYFRILKRSPNSKLLSTTLEGLSKFAHIMNIEYFSDLVNVIDSLLRDEDLGYRERLHCVETVFAVLSGQGDVLNIDPTRFYSHLYKDFLMINAGKTQSDMIILIRTLTSMMIKRRKKVSLQILLAFLKRAATLGTQVSHHAALACLGIIKTVMQQSKQTEVLLELDEELGSGRYDPYLMEPEYCNASTTALYELPLLRRHYHPTVQKLANNLMIGMPASGEGALPPELSKKNPEQFFEEYDSSKMAFKPSIPVPKKVQPKARPGHHIFTHPNFEDYCKEMAARNVSGPFDFTEAINK